MARTTYVRSNVGNVTGASLVIGSIVIDGANGALLVHTFNRNAGAGTVTGIILRGVGGGATVGTFTAFDTTRVIGNSDLQAWRLLTGGIANGTYELLVSLSGSRQTTVSWQYRTGVNQTTPIGTPVYVDALLTAGANTTDDQDLISVAACEDTNFPTPPTFAATGTGQTERTDSGESAQFMAVGEQNATGSPVTAAWTHSGSATGGDARGVLVYPLNGIVGGGGDPAPTVSSIDPVTGAPAGGTPCTITGTGFVDGAGVTFDGVAATGVTWVSATRIDCISPAHAAGAVDVVVTNPDAQFGTLAGGFTYAAVTLASFTVTEESSAALGDFRVGTAKNVLITAIGSDGQPFTSFTGTVEVTASGSNISAGSGTTAAFVAGELVHAVEFDQLATGITLGVADTATGTDTGTSAAFDVILPASGSAGCPPFGPPPSFN